MKKYLLVFLFSIFSLSIDWHSTDNIEKISNIAKVGDIILYKPSNATFVSRWGHCMIVVEGNKIVDYPSMKIGLREFPFYFLNNQKREFVLLRYKYINDDIRSKMLTDIYDNYLFKKYFPLIPLDMDLGLTYCSHFVYRIFKDTTNVDVLGLPKSNIIMPLDFLNSKYFEVIQL